MRGLSLWEANSSELNLASFDWVLVLRLYRGLSLLGWQLQAFHPPRNQAYKQRRCLHYSVPFSTSPCHIQLMWSQTHITPLYWCCKSRRTMERAIVTQAGAIVHIKHETKGQWISHSHSCVREGFPYLIYCPLFILLIFPFILRLLHFSYTKLA